MNMNTIDRDLSPGSVLFYRKPATDWLEALPLGNGRHGVMYFAHPLRDRLALNNDTLWSGYPECWRDNPFYDGYNDDRDRSASWREVQRLTMAGDYQAAEALYQKELVGPYTQGYLTQGDILLSFLNLDEADITSYRRALDLSRAVADMSFEAKGYHYSRSIFVSCPDQAAVMTMETDAPEGMSVRIEQQSPWVLESKAELIEDKFARIRVKGQAPSEAVPHYHSSAPDAVFFRRDPKLRGMRLASDLYIETDGRVEVVSVSGQTLVPEDCEGNYRERNILLEALEVRGAQYIRLFWSSQTSFNGYNRHPYTEGKDELACLENWWQNFDTDIVALRSRHLADYKALYDRVEFKLKTGETGLRDLPERLDRHNRKEEDMDLYVLLFNYSRYLMIAGSRPGTQALNLQGIWNKEIRAPWSSNYTININTEMNYWPVEVLALAECAEPLMRLIADLSEAGEATARTYYGAPGFVAHHNTDLWRHSRPVGCDSDRSLVYAGWPLGSGWLATHLRRNRIYAAPERLGEDYGILKKAAVFYLSQLCETKEKKLVFAPSTSPEHWYMKDGIRTVISRSAAMTQGILYDLFTDTLEAGLQAGGDEDFLTELREKRDRLEGYKISSVVPGMEGTLREWSDDCPEGDIGHRHVSHLYGLYPGRTITRKTPELREAVRRSMIRRGDEGTGWSLGWKTALWARLGDGEQALKMIRQQLRPVDIHGAASVVGGGSYPNLLDAHPPFQIDGNFANGAAVSEIFLQAEDDKDLWLLPALPASWKSGSIRGLRAPYLLEIDLTFDEGRLSEARFTNRGKEAREWTLNYAGERTTLSLAAGEERLVSYHS